MNPSQPLNHGTSTANANPVRSSIVKPGRFGFMFPELATSPWTTGDPAKDEKVAKELAAAMHSAEEKDGVIPAGFTYFGQFIDHDITFDPTSFGESVVDVDDLVNFRTPALDLDCLYGSGPRDQPFLYLRENGRVGRKFLIGRVVKPQDGAPGAADAKVQTLDGTFYDLPRACLTDENKTAIIGDKRNDENLIVAQLHRTMLHFHNAVCEEFPNMSFEEVRKTVMHHYQLVLLNEFLPAICGRQAVDDALNELRFYKIGPGELAAEPFIPVEFSGAAYRFGHSMVRSTYNFNRVFGPGTTFKLAFTFTAEGGFFGLPRYPSNWVLNWANFFPGLGANPQLARAIDPALSKELKISPTDTFLAELNLRRGAERLRLPSGQAVADRMCIKRLKKEELEAGVAGDTVKALQLSKSTPLWFYILKESEVKAGGKHLGPVGAAIVAEVFVGLLKADPESVLMNPNASPRLPSADGSFKIADLFKFIESNKGKSNIPVDGVIDPLGT